MGSFSFFFLPAELLRSGWVLYPIFCKLQTNFYFIYRFSLFFLDGIYGRFLDGITGFFNHGFHGIARIKGIFATEYTENTEGECQKSSELAFLIGQGWPCVLEASFCASHPDLPDCPSARRFLTPDFMRPHALLEGATRPSFRGGDFLRCALLTDEAD